MKGEINRDFYCSAGDFITSIMCQDAEGNCNACPAFHRKWPTPEQFKEEYGQDVPDEMPVWKRLTHENYATDDWEITTYSPFKRFGKIDRLQIVIACTPWGKPKADWRPK